MEQLNSYIQAARAQGQTDVQISETLVSAGWNTAQVNNAVFVKALPQAAPKGPDRSGLIVVIIALVIGIFLGLGVGFAIGHSGSNHKQTALKTNSTTTGVVACGSESCFSPKFASCSPATLDATTPLGTAYYLINSKHGSTCNMLIEYTANPNSAWVNQPMTCDFNNNKSLDSAVSDVFNDLLTGANSYSCSGPLVAILQSQ